MIIQLKQARAFCQLGRRSNQEDACYPNEDVIPATQRFFVVCDGVGGSESGEVASQTVCQAMADAMSEFNTNNDFTNNDFRSVLDAAYNALDRQATPHNKEMATTMTFVCFHGSGCTMAHIGDSRIYHFRKGKGILYRSDDHSLVNAMVHNGMLTPEKAVNNPQKNVITRYMEAVDADQNRCMATVMRTQDILANDYFLLCTDGVYNKISDEEMMCILFNQDINDNKKVETIAKRCKDSDDNNTAILISIAAVESDVVSINSLQSSEGTKKLPFERKGTEEIESIQQPKGNGLVNWVKRIFN